MSEQQLGRSFINSMDNGRCDISIKTLECGNGPNNRKTQHYQLNIDLDNNAYCSTKLEITFSDLIDLEMLNEMLVEAIVKAKKTALSPIPKVVREFKGFTLPSFTKPLNHDSPCSSVAPKSPTHYSIVNK